MDTLAEPSMEHYLSLGRRLLTAREVADRLGTSVSAVYEAARQKRIDGVVRFGRQIRFDPVRFEAWILEGGEALPGGWRRAT